MKTIWFNARKLGYRLFYGEKYTGPAIEVNKDMVCYLKTLCLSQLIENLYIIGVKENIIKIIGVEKNRYYQYDWQYYNEFNDLNSISNEVFLILKDIVNKHYGLL